MELRNSGKEEQWCFQYVGDLPSGLLGKKFYERSSKIGHAYSFSSIHELMSSILKIFFSSSVYPAASCWR
jgi:hypothetical protein